MAYLISVIPANDTKESMFGHQHFPSPAALANNVDPEEQSLPRPVLSENLGSL